MDSITLNEIQFGPEDQLVMDAKGIRMPAPGQAWSTKAFLGDGSQCQPIGDEAFIRRVEAVLMSILFEEISYPAESVDVLSHSEIDQVVAYMQMGMHDRVAARKERAEDKSAHWQDDQGLATGKLEKDEFFARVVDHLADKYDGPIGSDPPTWGFRRVGDKFDTFQPVARNFQDYRWERASTSMNRA